MTKSKHTFLEAAEIVLKQYGQPLGVKEIATLCDRGNFIESEGGTPHKTFSSKLSGDILKNGTGSKFMRVAEGTFALREWKDQYPEYNAERCTKKLYEEDIAVIPVTDLRNVIKKNGLTFTRESFTSLFNPIILPMKRATAEQTYEFVQLVSVFIVEFEGKILTHMRSARLPESRLHGEYSLMLGGHLGMEDFAQVELQLNAFDDDGLVDGSLLRELSEELIFETIPSIRRIGLLYDPSRNVSKQHLGLVYFVSLQEDKVQIGERGFLMHPKFETESEISDRRSDFENWSHILLDHLTEIKHVGS